MCLAVAFPELFQCLDDGVRGLHSARRHRLANDKSSSLQQQPCERFEGPQLGNDDHGLAKTSSVLHMTDVKTDNLLKLFGIL